MTNYGKGDTPELMTDEETGREFYRYPSGTEKWRDDGKFKHAPLTSPIKEDPRGMSLRRYEKSRRIAREAIDEGVGIPISHWGTGEGWRLIILHTVKTFMKSENIRGMSETLSKLASLSGYISEKNEVATPDSKTISAEPGALIELLQLLEDQRRDAINKERAIDAEVLPGTSHDADDDKLQWHPQ